jgi:cysteine-S-conjugate beta-lyase
MFDFDRLIDRRNTHSAKWDKMAALSGITAPDGLPLWVADMDFQAPPGVTAALKEEVERGTHGYYADTGSWAGSIKDWLEKRHNLTIEPSWVSATPGIVTALGLILQACSERDDEVIVFSPAYHMFGNMIVGNGRKPVYVPLEQQNGRYVMDFDLMRQKLSPKTKVVFFCSPHNPGGTVWTRDEIHALAQMCYSHNLILVSDEIHNDLVFPGAKHIPTLNAIPQEWWKNIITCVAATKTFNIAGAHVGACITTDPALKKKLDAAIFASGLHSYNLFGMIATEAAWRTGEPWLDALIPYLQTNRNAFETGVERAIPGAKAMRLASTYLAWVDFSRVPLPMDDVKKRITERARIFANAGPTFGPGGEPWMRFNFATPKSRVDDAVARLADAFSDIR